MEHGYAITIGMLFLAFGVFVYAIRGEIKEAYVSLKDDTSTKER